MKVDSFFVQDKNLPRFIPFYLSSDFVKSYIKKRPPWGPLGEFTYLRTFSRTYEEGGKKLKEKWYLTIKRVIEGVFTIQKRHCWINKVPWDNNKAQESAKIMYDLMFYMKFLPAGRGLWMMGTEFVEQRGGACLQSCAFTSTDNLKYDSLDPFRFLMDMSMLGVGVSFDTKGAGQIELKKPVHVKTIAKIPDTREGWVEAMAIVLSGFINGTEIPEFDYSLIRPEGAPIKGFGGVASGPQPLIDLVNSLNELLSRKIGKKISSTDITDIFCMIGKCVVSGNVRRSALASLGFANDTKFMDMKNYELYPKENEDETGWRQASNNSIFAEIGMDYSEPVKRTVTNGDPGYIWLENMRNYGRMIDPPNYADYKAKGVNPCFEQTLEDREACLLVETFPSRHYDYDDYQITLKYAYLYAKSVTLIPTHWEKTNSVMLRNRRIGTSQSGIIEAYARHGRREMLRWCDKGYQYLRKLDCIYSDWLCIPRSIKITSVKPSGTISLLPGVTPGIHYPEDEYYIRRIRVSNTSTLVEIMRKAGYHIEKDKKYPKTQVVIEFPMKSENFIKGKKEVTMWEQLLNAADYQKYWSDNQVSITVTFKPEEARDIETALSIFDTSLKAVSFMPLASGVYPQMPYEAIDEKKYHEMISKLSKPDYSTFIEQAVGEKFCDSEKCELST